MSDMGSTKATALSGWTRERGLGFTTFDYSGHGKSEGRFVDGTIGAWLNEAEVIFRQVTNGPQIVIGSSMGGYIALLLLRRLLESSPADAARLKALVLIAPAWDMTEELMWKQFPEDARQELLAKGVYPRPSDYGEPYPITRQLIEEGRQHLFAGKPFDPGRPVEILHGRLDRDVPFAHGKALAGFLTGGHARLTEVPDGEHRLSRPEDLARLYKILDRVIATA
jgi:pimeloyl-ACP methyl ester carboxylesterase